MDKCNPEVIPVSVQFPALDLQFWTYNGLCKAASLVGKPITADFLTGNRDKLDFARVLVEVKIGDKLKHVVSLKMPNGDVYSQRVVYEWLPINCPYFNIWGHEEERCGKKIANSKASLDALPSLS